MKQKLITLGIIVAMLISVIYVTPVQAAEADDDSEIITCKVIIYEHPTEPTEISAARATSTKSVSKTVVFQNADGDVLWQVRLDATFRYNGSQVFVQLPTRQHKPFHPVGKPEYLAARNLKTEHMQVHMATDTLAKAN